MFDVFQNEQSSQNKQLLLGFYVTVPTFKDIELIDFTSLEHFDVRNLYLLVSREDCFP